MLMDESYHTMDESYYTDSGCFLQKSPIFSGSFANSYYTDSEGIVSHSEWIVQPIADRAAKILRLFLQLFERSRILPLRFTIRTTYQKGTHDKSHENSGLPDTKLKVFRNNLEIFCHFFGN